MYRVLAIIVEHNIEAGYRVLNEDYFSYLDMTTANVKDSLLRGTPFSNIALLNNNIIFIECSKSRIPRIEKTRMFEKYSLSVINKIKSDYGFLYTIVNVLGKVEIVNDDVIKKHIKFGNISNAKILNDVVCGIRKPIPLIRRD